MMGNKYGNRYTVIDGIRFQSLKEAHHYQLLVALQRTGHIRDLRWQVPFKLEVNGQLICRYISDFTYTDNETNEYVVVDAKSPATRTPTYLLKKKLMAA